MKSKAVQGVQASRGVLWREALKTAAARRDFPSLLCAEKWIRVLDKAGMYPRWWGDDKGD